MKDNYIALAVPMFLAMIFVEWLADQRDSDSSFDLGDSVSNLGCGVLSQVASVLTAGVLVTVFGGLYARLAAYAPVQWTGAAAWALAIVGVDFCYYWWHRASHQINFLWAMHVVHHQSPRYNLTVALRQASFSVAISWIVYLPLALAGVPFKMLLASMALNTLYQFWIHTDKIGRLGLAERFLNTPSHHRVHHAINPRSIDRNYAGILISWDRLFGSFQPEDEIQTYGITSPFASLDPGWANLHYWFELARLSRAATGWKDKIKVWFMYPGWLPRGIEKSSITTAAPDADPTIARVSALVLAAGIIALCVLYRLPVSRPTTLGLGLLIAAGMLGIGRLLDQSLRPAADI